MDETRVAIAAANGDFAAALAAVLAGHGLTVTRVVTDPGGLDGWLDDGDVAVLSGWPPNVVPTAGRSVVLIEGGPDEMLEAVAAGAAGVVEADATFDEIAGVVGQVADGQAVVPPTMLGALLRSVVKRHRREREARQILDVLTPREREVFELTARGWDRDGIADKLFISPATARTHLQRVFAKLGIHSRAEAVALAARCGLDVEEP